ncbi:MAG: hypothetical protein QM495_12080 [Lutibacter sp.]|uniref:hypothetical protein n=1 Tax=Lutibacter sp. TaxID=1925666 RepID=UPI00385872C9
MKYIYKYLAFFILIIGCSDDNNLLDDVAIRGGFIQFEEVPELSFNILELDTAILSTKVIDPNNNITSCSLALIYNETVVNDFVVLTSFPTNLEIAISDIISALGLTNDDIKSNSKFTFLATIVTPTGTFSALTPNFVNGVNIGGDTASRLKSSSVRDAVDFAITFFTPPGKTIKGTSFEEVAVGDESARYTRNGGNNEDGDLVNGENPPFVDFISTGNEIGFDSEFVAIPGISSSSLGFSSERIGVTTALEDVQPFPDGTHAFHMEDADGAIRITFDTVDVPAGQENSGVSFQYFFRSTSWESKDGIKAYANITTDSGSEVIEIVNRLGSDANEVEGVWNTANSGFLKGVRSYQLVIQIQSGHDTEDIYIDNIIIFEPED